MMIPKTFASALIGAVVFATVAISGGRDAHAGACTTSGGGVYSCTGAAGADSTQNLGNTTSSTTITTTASFGINTASGNAFTLNGENGIDFEDSNLSSIIGANRGITATNRQDGANSTLGITTTGTVTGTAATGIFATTSNTGNGRTNISISAAAVSGGTNGINARNTTDGSVTVTATGAVTGTSADGIRAFADGNFSPSGASSVSVTAATVSGGANGIVAENNDGGGTNSHMTVTATGDVTGASGRGIYADNQSRRSNLTISAADVSGGTDGIRAKTFERLTLTAGAVTGGSGFGVRAETVGGSTSVGALQVSTGRVSGGSHGIWAQSNARAGLKITATDMVSGGSGDGIFAKSKSNGNNNTRNTTVTATGVSGDANGVRVINEAQSGTTSVTVTDTVTGGSAAGITVDTRSFNNGLTISAANVSGHTYGIRATGKGREISTAGDGDLTITAGSVSGAAADGIHADLSGGQLYSGKMKITAADVSGGTNGIYARNADSGSLTVIASGPVTGAGGSGINAIHAGDLATTSASQNLNITAADVNGTDRGIFASNDARTVFGTKTINVTVSGVVTGGTGAGIETSSTNGNAADKLVNITLNAGAAVSSANGVAILNDEGWSTTTVNSGASVTGAIELGGGTDNVIFDGGDFSGVTRFNGGGGTDSLRFLNAVGTVSGAIANMESVTVEGGSADVTFTTALNPVLTTIGSTSVTFGPGGDANGGITNDAGNSTLTVNAGGSVTGEINLGGGNDNLTFDGGDFSGVTRFQGSGGTDSLRFLNAVGTVSGAIANMESVTVEGTSDVTFTTALSPVLTTIGSTSVTLEAGGAANAGITNDAGNSTLTVNAGGSVTGAIGLGGGADNVVFDGGDFSSVTSFDGGGGIDSLRFLKNGTVSGAITNMESVTVEGNSDVTFTAALDTELTTIGSTSVTLESGGAANGGITNDAGSSTLTVNAGGSVAGAIGLGDGTDSLTFNGGSFNGVTSFDGGDGTDSLKFLNAAGTVSGAITDMESVTVEGGSADVTFTTAVNTALTTIGATSVKLNTGGAANAGITNDAGSSTVTVNAGGSVTGAVSLGGGTDSLTFNGGDFDSVTSFNGGGGTDSLKFLNAAGTVSGAITDMESVTVEGGSADVTFTTALNTTLTTIGSTSVTFGSGGAANAGITNNGGSSTVTINDGASVTGAISLDNGVDNLNVNGGSITGAISLGGGRDTMTVNGGSITGAISLGGGRDTMTVNGGSITGAINLGRDNDSLIFNGGDFSGVTAVDGSIGAADSLTFTNSAASVAGSQVLNIERLVVGSGGDVSFSGTVNANTLGIKTGGRVSGSATVKADVTVEAGATVGPGNSPGLMQVLGDVNYMSGSTLALELGGLAFGAEYDRIDVADDGSTAAVEGTATIEDGTIFDIDYYGAFTANLGDAFDVLVADVIDSGMLSAMLFDFSGAALGSGLDWDFNIVDFGGGREALRLIVVSNVTQPPSEVPAPGIMLIFALGLAGLGVAWRKRAA